MPPGINGSKNNVYGIFLRLKKSSVPYAGFYITNAYHSTSICCNRFDNVKFEDTESILEHTKRFFELTD